MLLCRLLVLTGFILFFSQPLNALPVSKYLPVTETYNPSVVTPESVLGFEVGEWHTRHDQLVNYFEQLAISSNRVKLTTMGYTYEKRKQLLVTISAEKNLANLASILKNRQQHDKNDSQSPNVIWLGYSVHGDEISGANAAMVVAYYLAAGQSTSVKTLLDDTIIVIEPSINPDGMDKFVQWVNTHRGITPNADPNHIEHIQNWPTGRTNHFGFDLNRDWLLLSQQESQNRMAYYQQYQPNVVGDFHEMGANSTYFFQPGIPSRTNPLTPKRNVELTQLLANYHAKTLDNHNRLYFSQESYDDFYYGKGSTYPDINGAIGILFEQASSRGFQQQTDNGLLTFEFGIQNQVLTSLSTLKGAWENKKLLADYRQDFYQQVQKAAKKEDFKGYLLHESADPYRLTALLNKLVQHGIKVYPLASDFRLNGKVYEKSASYYIPLLQPQYRVIKTLFEKVTEFNDNTFYDVSGWTMPLAMNIESQKVTRTWGLKLQSKPWISMSTPWQPPQANRYAYAFKWSNYLAPKLLNALLSQGIKARVATKAFQSSSQQKSLSFERGTIVIPAGIQTTPQWQQILIEQSKQNNIPLYGLSSGFTATGIDIGSRSLIPLSPIKVLLVGGKGVSQYEAGEVLFYLDEMLHIPVTVVEQSRLESIQLSAYSHVIMVDGNYGNLSAKVTANLNYWVKQGGVVIGQKRGAKWLSDQDILQVGYVNSHQIHDLFNTDNINYQDKEALAAKQRIAGAIFNANIDTTNPLAYGYQKNTLPVFRNNTLLFDSIAQPFIEVAKYEPSPLLSGYTDENVLRLVANSPALVAHNYGRGRVIATNDVLAFRGYWYGTNKLLANSLFFGKVLNSPYKK